MKTLIIISAFLMSTVSLAQTLEKGKVLITRSSNVILQDDVTMNEYKAALNEMYTAFNQAFDGIMEITYAIGDRGAKKASILVIRIMDLETRDAMWPCEDDMQSEGCQGNGLYGKIVEEHNLTPYLDKVNAMGKKTNWDSDYNVDWLIAH